jgi:hypothetical protein
MPYRGAPGKATRRLVLSVASDFTSSLLAVLPMDATEQSWGQMIARRWRLTLLLAALGGAVLIPVAIADTVAPPLDM